MDYKSFGFYKFDDNEKCIGWWLYQFEGLDIEVNIQGNEQGVDQMLFDYAIDILQNNYEDIVNLAKSRLQHWGPTTSKGYCVEGIYFGKFAYGPEQMLRSGFKMVLSNEGGRHEGINGDYTINFTQNKWPIGYEFSLC